MALNALVDSFLPQSENMWAEGLVNRLTRFCHKVCSFGDVCKSTLKHFIFLT